MKTITANLNDSLNGGKVTAFNYSHGLNELGGSWSAQVAGGNFVAGNSITFSGVMTNGIISKAQKDSTGLWHIEGYDAGIRLMKSTPEISDLPTGNANTVITHLASFCGVGLNMSGNGLDGFNVRSVISGSTCAEAILELAMLSGMVAFIDKNGRLNVTAPSNITTPPFTDVIDDSGSDFDLDGYATQVTVILRKSSVQNDNNDEPSGNETEYYTGTTPSTTPDRVTYSGSFSNGSYSVTMLEPFGVAEREETTITENGVTVHTVQTHDYDYKHKTVWRENQEYMLFAFIETGYTLTKTTTGTYAAGITFTETTTETMSREVFSPFDAVGVPDDWKGQLGMVMSETITRSTVREGGKAPTDDMPSYSPPFDTQITRKYSRERRGSGLLCNEVEKRYEARQVGSISPVKVNGEAIPHFMRNSNLAIQTHSTPEWVEIDTYRTYYEQYDRDGKCVVSTRSEYSDDGSKWLVEHALSDTGDEDLNEYQKAYAKFSQASNGVEVSIGTSIINQAWQFAEVQGRIRNTVSENDEDAIFNNVDDWYNNGEYISAYTCPHYSSSTDTCNAFAVVDAEEGNECYRRNSNYLWKTCPRAVEALELAREKEKTQLDEPFIGTAGGSSSSPSVGYKREVYVDDVITDEQAQSIANTIASNILKVKGTKGLRKTVTVPYNASFEPDGAIVEVSHDWENLQTQVTYRHSGTIPDFLIAQSVSGIASFVSARDTSRLSTPQYGVITEIENGNISVKVGSSTVKCTSKLKNLGTGDTVLVSFPSGNKLRGQVISRL